MRKMGLINFRPELMTTLESLSEVVSAVSILKPTAVDEDLALRNLMLSDDDDDDLFLTS